MDIDRHLDLPGILAMWGQGGCILENIEVEDGELTRFDKRLRNAREHVWSRWQKERIDSLMDAHRINRTDNQPPQIGEVMLIVGEEKNRGLWKKGKVVRIVKGRDDVVRGVILLRKGKQLERPLQAVCPLEIRCIEEEPRHESSHETTEPMYEKQGEQLRKSALD